jgi:poly(beta-D-mannuronate) lyase
MVTGQRAMRASLSRVTRGAAFAAYMSLSGCGLQVGEWLGGEGAAGSDQGLATVFRLRAAHSDKCLEVAEASTLDQAQVKQFPCADGDAQRFELRDIGDGEHAIVAVHSQKCLGVAGNSSGNGVLIQQYACTDGERQRWVLEASGDGHKSIRSVKTGKCMDVDGRSTEDGANLQQWRCHGNTNQQFRLEPVDRDDGDDDDGGDDDPGPGEPPLPACQRTVQVASSDELRSALGRVRAGDCLELADGKYTFPSIAARATEDAPIVIRAKQTLGAAIESGSLELRGAAHVIVQGLHFRSSGHINLEDCDHCRVSRFRIERKETVDSDWVSVRGKSRDCRIDHNDFGPQTKQANMVMLAGKGAQIVQRTRIDHNYFHDVQYSGGNGWETIRAGLSNYTFSSAFTVIEHNLFERAHSDPETISVKSSDNIVRYNTMRETRGQFTLRHGNRNEVYGNYIIGGLDKSGGIRIYGGDHKIYNNYLVDIDGPAILVDSGKSDDDSGALKDHKVSYRVQVVFNTIVSETGVKIGSGKPLKPKDCVVAYNVLEGDGALLRQESGTENTDSRGNIVHGGSTNVGGTQRVDPELEADGQVMRIGSSSPAIDGARADFDWVSEDIAGRRRGTPDIGAHERSSDPAKYKLLSRNDVGPFAP